MSDGEDEQPQQAVAREVNKLSLSLFIEIYSSRNVISFLKQWNSKMLKSDDLHCYLILSEDAFRLAEPVVTPSDLDSALLIARRFEAANATMKTLAREAT